MAKKHPLCKTDDITPGDKRLFKVGSRSICLFNVKGEYHAMLNVCPHQGAALCEGPVCGTNSPTDEYEYQFIREGEIIRCSRHGWEFDIRTGESVGISDMKAKIYPVEIADGEVSVLL